MANLKDIRTRIASVKSTRQITSAMKMVSAAKLRKAQDLIIQLRPYALKLAEILSNLSGCINPEENPYAFKKNIKKVLLVVITSNRGLCGSFNSNVVKLTIQKIKEKYAALNENSQVDILCLGKKGGDLLKLRKYNVIEINSGIYDNLSYENVLPITQKIMDQFISGEYDQIDLAYNHFKNAATQIAAYEQFLPIASSEEEEEETVINTDYIFEPSKEYIINELIPKSLKIHFYRAILDSNASEHGARMTSMHQATDNATELIKVLTLDYNKARQAAITNEILEIVGGAEALKG